MHGDAQARYRGLIRFSLAAVLCAVLGLACDQNALAAAEKPSPADAKVMRETLPNGLRVVIVQNRLAPVVATAVNYLVGSDEAPAGFPGTAHAQEHMMFRGAPGLSAEQLADIGSIMGGNFNANTRESVTQYLYTVPADDMDMALRIEAIRMSGVNDAQDAWSKERGAIEQEVAQDISSPFYRLYEKLRTALFPGSIYEHDALGTKDTFDRTTAASLKQFYDAWYAPNNAILVIVGDLDPAATLAKVKALFGGIAAKRLPARPALALGAVADRSIAIATDRPSATQLVALRLPGLDSADYPALEILSDVLGSQRFDLYGLVTQGRAMAAEFSFDPLPRAGIGYAAVSFRADGDPKRMDDVIRAILNQVRIHGVPADLVQAAKLQERRQVEFQKNSIAGLASAWPDALALYGLSSPDEDLARLERVSTADVNRVAKKYLDLDHAISATLSPQSSGAPVASGGGFGGQESIALGEANGGALPDWANTLVSRLVPPASSLHPIVSHLANGLTVIVQPTTVSNTVSIFGHIRHRAEVEEPSGKEGVSLVLDELMSYGTQAHDRIAFQQALDAIGAQENAGTDFDMKVLSRDFDRGVALLAENELRPALPGPALENLKGQFGAYIAARNKSPAYLAQRSLRASLYPANDPMLRQADAGTITGLSGDDLVSYYRHAYRPELATIVVIGNVTATRAKAVIAKYFGAWQAVGPTPQVDLPAIPPNRAAKLAVPDASRIQDNVVLAQTLSLPRTHPDYHALALGNAVLGGGFYATRLSIDLRKNAGLVYSVGSDLQPGRTRSAFLVRYASDPRNVGRADDTIAREIGAMQTAPVSAVELQKAKALLLRQIPLNESGVDEIAQGILTNQDLGLPVDENARAAERYIGLSPADVMAAFQTWMRPADLVRTSQGPLP